MNQKPVSYRQTDVRWKDLPYQTSGETATIGGSGCGPTCAAMLIETLTGKVCTPEDACKWSMEHGYKALNQGTYYSYFKPQFEAFGIDCVQLNHTSLYGDHDNIIHEDAAALVRDGGYLIACMGKGLWTSSGAAARSGMGNTRSQYIPHVVMQIRESITTQPTRISRSLG